MKLFFDNIVIKDNKGWFYNNGYPGLFQIDLLTKEVFCISKPQKDNNKWGHSYTDIAWLDNKLILTPLNEKKITVFDMSAEKQEDICLKSGITGTNRLYSSFSFGNSMFFLSEQSDKIYRFDIKTYQMDEINILPSEVTNKESASRFWNEHVITSDKYAYLMVNGSNVIVCMDMISAKSRFFHIGDDAYELYDICAIKEDLWLTTKNGKIVQWNGFDGILFEYEPKSEEGMYERRLYRIGAIENQIVVFGIYRDGSVLLINPDTYDIQMKQIDILHFEYDYIYEKWEDNFISVRINEMGLFFQHKNGSFYKSKSLTGEVYESIRIDEKVYIDIGDFYHVEYFDFSLREFILFQHKCQTAEKKSSVGIKIYRECMSRM